MTKSRKVLLGLATAAITFATAGFAVANASSGPDNPFDNPDGALCEEWAAGDPVPVADTDLTVQVNFYTLCQLASLIEGHGHLGGAESVDPFTSGQIHVAFREMANLVTDNLRRPGGSLRDTVCGDVEAIAVTGIGNGATDLGPALSAAFQESVRTAVRKLELRLDSGC